MTMLEEVAAAYLILAPVVVTAGLVGVGLWIAARRLALAGAHHRLRRPRRRDLD